MNDVERLHTMWDRQLIKGCLICDHGTGPDTARMCRSPNVATVRRPLVPVHEARANSGQCGPEARHQDFPGLYASVPRSA